MNFEESYNLVKNKFMEADLSAVNKDFSAIICLQGEEDRYVYVAYIGGQKIIEPVRHSSANIFISLSEETADQLLNKELDPFKAYTTGKVKAKGNIFLALSMYKSYKKSKGQM